MKGVPAGEGFVGIPGKIRLVSATKPRPQLGEKRWLCICSRENLPEHHNCPRCGRARDAVLGGETAYEMRHKEAA
jgi:hypothetical protein